MPILSLAPKSQVKHHAHTPTCQFSRRPQNHKFNQFTLTHRHANSLAGPKIAGQTSRSHTDMPILSPAPKSQVQSIHANTHQHVNSLAGPKITSSKTRSHTDMPIPPPATRSHSRQLATCQFSGWSQNHRPKKSRSHTDMSILWLATRSASRQLATERNCRKHSNPPKSSCFCKKGNQDIQSCWKQHKIPKLRILLEGHPSNTKLLEATQNPKTSDFVRKAAQTYEAVGSNTKHQNFVFCKKDIQATRSCWKQHKTPKLHIL